MTLTQTTDALYPERLFGHRSQELPCLRFVTVNGVEYLTDNYLMIRTDWMQPLTGDWYALRAAQTIESPSILRALAAELVREAPAKRFPARTVCALEHAGLGIAPLTGETYLHAIVSGLQPIGLVMALTREGARYGVVPGLRPWPQQIDPDHVCDDYCDEYGDDDSCATLPDPWIPGNSR